VTQFATVHPPGVFCWPELVTTDSDAAARFYGAVFEWTRTAIDLDDGEYTVFQVAGEDACGSHTPRTTEAGFPRWNCSVSVASADETAARALELDGHLLVEAFDLGEASRIAVLCDNQGASFSLWQPRGRAGTARVNEPGFLCWTELIAINVGAAEGFYTKLFGWGSRRHRFGEYVEFLRGHDLVAGMLRTPPGRGSSGSHWLPYFAVVDVDDAVQVARRNFGTIVGRPMDIPMIGRSAVLRDPQGAMFGVFGMNEAA
jgi:predicted enzyme related to lactoylglutathione lyase